MEILIELVRDSTVARGYGKTHGQKNTERGCQLVGTVSAPFKAGEHGQAAVKVIDDQGNEFLVVKALNGAR